MWLSSSSGSPSPPFKGRGRGGVCIVITHHCFRFLDKYAAKLLKISEDIWDRSNLNKKDQNRSNELCRLSVISYLCRKMAMEEKKWVNTEQMLEDLRRDANNEHQYAHWLGGALHTTHWIEFDSEKDMFGDSLDWSDYYWYTEAEFLARYAGHWWKREH